MAKNLRESAELLFVRAKRYKKGVLDSLPEPVFENESASVDDF